PFACGAAVANRGVHVLASAGDGATFSEGINHLVHAIRNNYDVTFILHNNSNYGLTTGQPSATTRKGQHMNLAPDGVFLEPINALEFALSLNPTFAARTFSGNVNQMTEIIRAGIQHKGFSFIEVLQHCPSYNKATPHEWYQERVYDTLDIEEYDNSNLAWAKILAADLDHKIATGILYQRTDAADFLGMQAARKGITTELVNEVGPVDVTPLVGMFR
ncbi:hypothetical protein KC640_03755, partial [Candidatus Dojkabacteria bacterium]|nr:hypothetical protein [Candidatus Dojkabacteria bacterium]